MFDEASQSALLLALIAGLSTLIGAVIVILTGKMSKKLLSAALGFASGVLISACFLDLFPEAEEFFHQVSGEKGAMALSVAFLIIGTLLALVADRLIPHNCGHDHHGHGHDHDHGHDSEQCPKDVERVGIVSTLAISLHNFPEGIALFVAGYEDITLGVALCIAVVLHNIPGGISIAAPIYYASGSRVKAVMYTLIPSLVQPVGALLACLVLKNIMGPFAMGAMYAVVAGFMLFMALAELYPMSRSYGSGTLSLLSLMAGAVIMPLTHIIG